MQHENIAHKKSGTAGGTTIVFDGIGREQHVAVFTTCLTKMHTTTKEEEQKSTYSRAGLGGVLSLFHV